MKKWLVPLACLMVLAAGLSVARWRGIDLTALPGFGSQAGLASPRQDSKTVQSAKGRGIIPVEVASATSRQLSDDIAAIGTLLAEESTIISPETSGRIAEILFRDGDTVSKGQPLFRLDSDLANAALAEANSRFVLAESNFKRTQTLRKSGNIAETAFDESATGLEVARAAVESAKVNLGKLTISAPFGGTLGFRGVSEGAYVTAGAGLVQLDAINSLKVSFSVPELQQSRIAIGQKVEVTADAVPGAVFPATISGVAPSIEVTGRALQVRAGLDNAALKLRPGLLVRVLAKGPWRDSVVVPEAAIVQRGDGAVVYIVENKAAREARVRLGSRAGGDVEVIEGVAQGAEVVIAGNTRLNDGSAVEVVASPTQNE